MARRSKRYRYRGKSTISPAVPILAVLCLVAALVSLFLHNNLVYSRDGSRLELKDGESAMVEENSETLDYDLIIEN